MSHQPIPKSPRIITACDRCRSSKTKCDRKQPTCGRCAKYRLDCTWCLSSTQRISISRENIESIGTKRLVPRSSQEHLALCQALQQFEDLIRSLRPILTECDRLTVDSAVSHIRERLPPDYFRLPEQADTPQSFPHISSNHGNQNLGSMVTQRYYGRASDVHFFNKVKEMFQPGLGVNSVQGALPCYSQDPPARSNDPPVLPFLPQRETADEYVDTYFSTIHIAYPFVCKPRFWSAYKDFWQGVGNKQRHPSWLGLLFTIFAIGAFYNSFPCSGADGHLHSKLFDQAMLFGNDVTTQYTCDDVCTLLAQCFYLLATCQIERTWNVLGLAIRVGQSVGLHVEDSITENASRLIEQEVRRRVWYSLYVLDRLLALQLGRPVAIHETEYHVSLPSELADIDSPVSSHGSGSVQDYFIQVIELSRIVDFVVTLYLQADSEQNLASQTPLLDKRLSVWKTNLPRHLRFDLGHTFEKGGVFKKQRNMLAIKFHHLRCLIHRPFLNVSSPQHSKTHFRLLICVSEARKIVHLLHYVFDERSLLYDFPWWQMISCLVYASSTLLFARTQILELHGMETGELHPETLDEDAETCLKVFDSLSANFDAARQAKVMMRDLRNLHLSVDDNADQSSTTVFSFATAFVPTIFPSTGESNATSFDQTMPEEGFEDDTVHWNWSSSTMFDQVNQTTQIPVQFPTRIPISAPIPDSFDFRDECDWLHNRIR